MFTKMIEILFVMIVVLSLGLLIFGGVTGIAHAYEITYCQSLDASEPACQDLGDQDF